MNDNEKIINVPSYETYNSDDDFSRDNGILNRCYAESTVVTIPSDVKKITKDAFKYLENKKKRERDWKRFCIETEEENPKPLRKIVLPNSVTEIEEGAFANLEYLEEINLPNGITEIPNDLFCNCHNLKEIDIPDTVTKIGDNAFSCCQNLKKINIPASIEEIGKSSFYMCGGMKGKIFKFSRSLKKIGEQAFFMTGARIAIFADCECGEGAFYGCEDRVWKEI
ncbi:MAG: leucine-rich repeat domain-containing protein [Prevotella sp.]|nr:leucine-rich repeat domain-containing protein [Alistipes senegalensis]MCM1358698.1 leucine-rich repeat domain-containing protein [Prevotella sp.]MCM1472830.1 leucine-rich repeat domain-containing protein [Muribaculaceae bacterium]